MFGKGKKARIGYTSIPGTPVIPKMLGMPKIPGIPEIPIEPKVPRGIPKKEQTKHRQEIYESEEKYPTADVEYINLRLYTKEEVKKMSVVELDKSKIFDRTMGVTSSGLYCYTCGRDYYNCPGHYGSLSMRIWMVHPQLYKIVVQVLTCVCRRCLQLMIPQAELRELNITGTGVTKLAKLYAVAKTKHKCPDPSCVTPCEACAECEAGRPCPRGRSVSNYVYKSKESQRSRQIVYALPKGSKSATGRLDDDELYGMLSNISDEVALELGFTNGAHPKMLMVSAVPVIPPSVRFSTYDYGRQCINPLNTEYKAILSKVDAYRVGAGTKSDPRQEIKYHYTYFIDSSKTRTRDGTMKTLKQKIQGKEGNIRVTNQ